MLLYLKHFGGYINSIETTVAKIQAKTFIRLLLNWFYNIRCSIFSTFVVIFS